jgi:RNA polymerase sigma-70 factor, ECF subfamily
MGSRPGAISQKLSKNREEPLPIFGTMVKASEFITVKNETARTQHWLDALQQGNRDAFAQLFEHYRPRLKQMIEMRLDSRLSGRIDPTDVLQEAYLDAADQVGRYLESPDVAFYVWLRSQTWDRLLTLHRRHLDAQCRAVDREWNDSAFARSSMILARRLMADQTSPSQGAVRAEVCAQVKAAVERLDPEDREVILMRHFEGMSNLETAQALGLAASGASMRYGRALLRLKDVLTSTFGSGTSAP